MASTGRSGGRQTGKGPGGGGRYLVLFLFAVAVLSFYIGFRTALPPHTTRAETQSQNAHTEPLSGHRPASPESPSARLIPAPHLSSHGMPSEVPKAKPTTPTAVAPKPKPPTAGGSPTPTAGPVAAHHPAGVAVVPLRPLKPQPRAAIIIDDFGNSFEEAEGFIHARLPLTLSVLPQLPYSVRIADDGRAEGKTIMLHLPMEPMSNRNPGPGTIKTDMSDADVTHLVATNLDSVPGAVGVNNHEGSKATADPRIMHIVLGMLRARNLFFVDSMTTMNSAGPAEAKRLGLRFAIRNVFLDNEEDDQAIKNQINVLIQDAREHGEAIGIGHVKARTLRCLLDMAPSFEAEGVKLVDVQELIR